MTTANTTRDAGHGAPLDLDLLIMNLSGSAEIAAMVVDQFLIHVTPQVDDVRRAIAAGDASWVRDAAHRHKGSLAAIYAGPAREVAGAIEHAARRGDLADASQLLATLDALSAELVACLTSWRASYAARQEPPR